MSPRLALILTTIILTCGAVLLLFATGHVPDPARSDLAAYQEGQQLFRSGGDPYSTAAIRKFQCPGETKCHLVMVWNPPLIFVSAGPIISLLPSNFLAFWSGISMLCGIGLLCAGYRFACGGLPSPIVVITGCLASLGLLKEVEMGQFSSVVAMATVAGVWCYFQRRDFLCGCLVAVAGLKPHIFFVQGILLTIWVVRERRWTVLITAAVIIIGESVAAELIRPGITQLWTGRETWPTDLLGATLSSLIRGWIGAHGQEDLPKLAPGLALTCAAIFAVHQRWFTAPIRMSTMVVAIGLNPFFAPYGHNFEQVLLLVPFGYIAGLTSTGELPRRTYQLLVGLLITVGLALPAAVGDPDIGQLPLSWFTPTLAWLIFTVFLVRTQGQQADASTAT